MLPLSGLRVVVTRATQQADDLAQLLRARGAAAIVMPVIGIAPPTNPGPLNNAIAQLDCYDWIVFTSTNAIRAVGYKECRARIATVGNATREFAERHGWKVDITPETYVAEALVEKLGGEPLSGKRILIPSAAVTRDFVRAELTRQGATVEVVEAYRNVIPEEAAQLARETFHPPFPDWITFASSSAVSNLISLVPADTLRRSRIASIGPVTSKTLRQYSLSIDAEPMEHTIPGLVDAIVQAVSSPKTA